jgi:hypothetical protein
MSATRAGPCPLSIAYAQRAQYNALQHSRRITLAHYLPQAQEAIIYLGENKNDDVNGLSFIEKVLNNPMPALHTLAYKLGDFHPRWRLTSSFLGGQTSSLTTLVLQQVVISSDDLSFPVLVHLQLKYVQVADTPGQLLRLLDASPNLEGLLLIDLEFPNTDGTLWPVSLLRIRNFHLESNIQTIVRLLGILPISSQLYSIRVSESPDPDFDRTAHAIAIRAEAFHFARNAFQAIHPAAALTPHMCPSAFLYNLALKSSSYDQRLVYCDTVHDVAAWDDVFTSLEALSLDETLLYDIFSDATAVPVHKLPSLKRIMIQDGFPADRFRDGLFPNGDAEFIPFIAWLTARAQAELRVSLVKFIYRDNRYYRQPNVEELAEKLRERLRDEVLTDEVIQEGKPSVVRASTPIRWRPFCPP